MSFRRNNQNQQQDQYGQYGHQGQNGGYPGQHQYQGNQYGGAQQQPQQQPQSPYQESMNSPRQGSYPGQQQYQYNPQHYAAQAQQQAPVQQYNPQNYANTAQSSYGQQSYNPQMYSPMSAYPSSPAQGMGATSGPMDTYGWPQSPYSPQAHTQAQSPQQRPGFSPQQQYSPHMPQHSQSYPSSQSSPHPQHTAQAVPAGPISHPQDAPYPLGDPRPHSQSYGGSAQHYSIAHQVADLREQWPPSPQTYQPQHAQQSPSPVYRPSPYTSSLPSPPVTTQGPTPPAHAPGRSNTISRPLPAAPLSDPDDDYFKGQNDNRGYGQEDAERVQNELYQEVEDAVMGAGNQRRQSPYISVSQAPYDSGPTSAPLFAPTSPNLNRNGSVNSNNPSANQYSSESDLDGAYGVDLMREAEEDARRRSSGPGYAPVISQYGSQRGSRQQHLMPQPEVSDGENYETFDMSGLGGGPNVGFSTHMVDPSVLAAGGDLNGYNTYSQPPSQQSSMRRSHPSNSSHQSRDYEYGMDSIHPFPPFNSAARVDAGGTGGLAEPSADGRRQSYDEGDEYTLLDGGMPERFPDEPPDIFYQAASTSYRPLPPPPHMPSNERAQPPQLQTDLRDQGQAPYPTGPDAFTYNQQGQWVPRSTSLVSHTTTPSVQQPLRSKTDAEERRLKAARTPLSTVEPTPTLTPSIDLPTLPGKRFMPSQLGAPAFKKCDEPWSLMSLLKWLLQVTSPEQDTEIKEAEVKEALVALFTNKVPTMNIADAEGLSSRVVQDMYDAGTLVTTEEWVKIVPGFMSGVIFQLTGSGCYAPTLHDHIVPGRCYSHHCQRTLKKVNLLTQPVRTKETWAEFYHLKKEDWETKDKKDLERQYMLHEIVQTEDMYMVQLNVLQTLYRDALSAVEPSIITPKRKDKFLKDVFGRVDAIRQASEDHLLPQLKYRQQEQGPWIVGFSDIFRQWIRKAKTAYIDYAGGFPGATFMVRQEIDRNMEFRNFIDRVRNDKRSEKLGWDTFLKAPITRLQRYTLLLSTVLKNMKTESEEKTNLKIAFDEVRSVTLECDVRVAEMQRKVDMTDLSHKLVLRPGMQSEVQLNLDHFGRELIHRGDLQRMGGNRFTWLDSHALLFDHYFILAKTVAQRAEQGGKMEKYDISRLPIPMDLLILESANDPAVQKSSYVKGITSVRDVTGRTTTPEQGGLGRAPSSTGPGAPLQHTNTAASGASLQAVTSLGDSKDADKIMYPFKVKHLGRETYTLFAPTEQARRDWCTKLIEAKTKHAASLYNQNAEPFKLRVMADSAFVIETAPSAGGKTPVIKGTPVDRAIKEVEQRFKGTGRPGPICRARVNCATSFETPYPQRKMTAVGTEYGVYMCELDNPRGWTNIIPASRVTQIAVLEEFNLFLLLTDRALIAYQLDVVCSSQSNGPSPSSESIAKAAQKVSGSRDVGFFVVGRMKDRMLVFYKKRENMASVFKVQEPILQKATEKKTRGIFKRGNTEFFRSYDEFYIPAECTGINLFHSSLAVSTARGFEVLTLDKKQPWSVPDLGPAHVQNIATHIKDQKALAMLRLSDQEFLLVYANCAVYVNKHGEVSRSVIMGFVGNANSVALYGAYLILFDSDFVEIRNAQNGRLKQIIAGKEIKCLDDGGSWSSAGQQGANGTPDGAFSAGRTVKLVMQHPETEKTQIVMELLLNEKMKEQ